MTNICYLNIWCHNIIYINLTHIYVHVHANTYSYMSIMYWLIAKIAINKYSFHLYIFKNFNFFFKSVDFVFVLILLTHNKSLIIIILLLLLLLYYHTIYSTKLKDHLKSALKEKILNYLCKKWLSNDRAMFKKDFKASYFNFCSWVVK